MKDKQKTSKVLVLVEFLIWKLNMFNLNDTYFTYSFCTYVSNFKIKKIKFSEVNMKSLTKPAREAGEPASDVHEEEQSLKSCQRTGPASEPLLSLGSNMLPFVALPFISGTSIFL